MKITTGLVIGLSLMLTVMSTKIGGQEGSDSQQPLIVGTKEAPPFSMKTSDGQWTGLSIDLWQQIATELNLRYEFRELSLNQLIEGVKDGSLDAAVAALTITPEREKELDLTHAFYTTGLGIAVAGKPHNPCLPLSKALFQLHF
jgi:ABC-type amino acid transport substrate-binding protein